ncbi:Fructosamine/Ketosamine-3-kinase [Boletus edulis BED1]|uniref:protein-ribulosamine 3-kinase n=1 Tax=Boletus edulis BED1 TaxID=1328754 RepID=A0AAD4GI62_BOLED|nr:Fructosamine/Ketosamine-3-kinase [Boletus edulis BED1]
MPDISSIFLPHLHNIEPDAQFTLNLPIVTSSAGNRYYAKLGNVTESDQYTGEAESLKAIHAAAPGLAPKVNAAGVGCGDSNEAVGRPYFLSEYKDIGSLSTKPAEILGERIAVELHAFKSNKGYGFDVPTYCGATRQENGWFETWEECYSSMIENLLLKLKGSHGSTELILKGEEVRSRVIPWLLRPLRIEPVLLHGDLWSGNTGVDRINGQPVIFDPSSYFGHNEADLAIARIFGGIPSAFFSSYHKHMPKSEPAEQYDLRGDLYELYHYLNHTVLFGVSRPIGWINVLMTLITGWIRE